ncbi:MAG: hypothetical protein KatS3mg111_1256 [Pirellulaceae bacterium]|nr:MAG: hypothetical protein KatS3mg111_1256 [Pirellulaceae bacterium]
MFNRRTWLKRAFRGWGILAATSLHSWGRLWAQEGNSLNSAEQLTDRNVVSLEDQLVKGLRVVRPDQKLWLKRVVLLVDQKKLPRAMVNVVFKWARQRNPDVPFPYFQFAMRELAKRRGIQLP